MHYDQDIFITLAPNQVGAFDEFVKGLTNVQQPDQVIRHKSDAVCYCWLDRDIKDFGMTEDGYEPLLQYLWKLEQKDWSWDEIDDYDSYNMKTWWREGTFYRTAFARKNKLYSPKGNWYDERKVLGVTVMTATVESRSLRSSVPKCDYCKSELLCVERPDSGCNWFCPVCDIGHGHIRTKSKDLRKLEKWMKKQYGGRVQMFDYHFMDQAAYMGLGKNNVGKLETALNDMEAELEAMCRKKKWMVSRKDLWSIANSSRYEWRMGAMA